MTSSGIDRRQETINHDVDGVLALGRGAPLPDTSRSLVCDLTAQMVQRYPTRIAVRSGEEAVSYADLDAWAGRIAAGLRDAGVTCGSRVGVLVAPSTAMVAAVLGILRAGAAYVPLDHAWPDRRMANLLADARTVGVVTTSDAEHRLAGQDIPIFRPDTAPSGAAEAEAPGTEPAGADDPAYVIYTSGSTGEPKGVLVNHRQLAASTMARRLVYPGESTFLLVSPLAFDSSVAGIWGTLTSGGTLVVATADQVRDSDRLLDLIEGCQVTRLLCVPSLYQVLLDAAEWRGRHRLGSLDTVIVAGEALPEPLVRRHFSTYRRAVALVNEYGPTETSVWASYRRFDAPGPVSIGGPVPGARLYVLDDQRRPVPRGIEGELFVGGEGVSDGYLGRPEATARVFVEDQFAGGTGARMYRTGDRVRWNDDGTLDFLGRRDHQLKIRGHRVELGAVEAELRSIPGVRDAVVVPDRARTALAGFVLAEAGVKPEAIRSQLAERLPAAMVPATIQVRERFPLTFSGKVDRVELQAATELAPTVHSGAESSMAMDGQTAAVAAAWSEVLNVSKLPTDANFFDVGGHSYGLFQLQNALERHTGVRPSVVALFRHTTIATQAAFIRAGDAATPASLPDRRHAAVRRAQAARASRRRTAGGDRDMTGTVDDWLTPASEDPTAGYRLVCFPHAGGSAAFFRDWGTQLAGVEVRTVLYPGRAERISEPPPASLRELSAQVASALAELDDRPLALFGHSMGAVVALETARSLQDLGAHPSHLFASGSRHAPLPAPDPAVVDDDDAVAAQLAALGGTEPALVDDSYFRELVLPYVRSDSRMFHAYLHRTQPLLHCPVTTIVGDVDTDADRRPWAELTDRGHCEHVLPGDHFYLVTSPPYQLIRETLAVNR